jgi:hypothetical protein
MKLAGVRRGAEEVELRVSDIVAAVMDLRLR